MKKRNLLTLGLCISLPLLAGFIAGMATATGVSTWYVTLEKPFFTPPNYLFGPVWTVLYILMGVSSFIVYMKKDAVLRVPALTAYVLQLFLNFSWSFLFFYWQRPDLALADIVLLWISVLVMIRLFYKTDALAAWLQVPYHLWITYATALNAAVWWLNR